MGLLVQARLISPGNIRSMNEYFRIGTGYLVAPETCPKTKDTEELSAKDAVSLMQLLASFISSYFI